MYAWSDLIYVFSISLSNFHLKCYVNCCLCQYDVIAVLVGVVSSYEESHNNMPKFYGYMLPNLSHNLYEVQSVYINNVASSSLLRDIR